MIPHEQTIVFCPPGALYPDGTSNMLKMDDSVPPGGSYTYRWEVRPEFAPTDDDANCLTWVYHSHLDAPKDIASGLIGALLTCKKGRKNAILCVLHFLSYLNVFTWDSSGSAATHSMSYPVYSIIWLGKKKGLVNFALLVLIMFHLQTWRE